MIPSLRLRGGQGELKENLRGLKLLEMDALGGSGSRGYGRIAIEFDDQTRNEKTITLNLFETGGKLDEKSSN